MQYMYLSVPVVHNGGLLFVCSYRYVMYSKAQTFGHSYYFFILKCGKVIKAFKLNNILECSILID